MSNSLMVDTQSFQTIVDFLRFGLSRFQSQALHYGHGTDNAWDDVWSLILGSLDLPYDLDPLLLQGRLTQDEKSKLCEQLEQRLFARVPVPYLINKAYFCDLSFYVDERVLIPRSPIAELIREHFSPWIEYDEVGHILDMCTGSGCIAIACCYAFPEALVDAVDVSKEALAVAEINRDRHQVQDQLTLIESDGFQSVPTVLYDLIVCNPPYVGHEEMQSLPDEYRHEPVLALEAQNNGLAFVEELLQTAGMYLSDHGILVVEVGNSESVLVDAYPDVPFTWLDFQNGGQGVFVLTAQQLKRGLE